MQADPLGLGAAEATDPLSLNLYSYVGNDPINAIDPNGTNYQIIYGEACTSYGWTDENGNFHETGRRCSTYVAGVIIWGNGGGLSGGGSNGGSVGGGQIGGGGGGGGENGNPPVIQAKPPQSSFSDCFEKHRVSSAVGTMFGDTAESMAKGVSVASYISFAGDMVATGVKAFGKTLGSPQPYASGLNWAFRRISSGGLRGTLVSIGNKVTPVLAITAVFTGAYDLTIAAQCASGVLK